MGEQDEKRSNEDWGGWMGITSKEGDYVQIGDVCLVYISRTLQGSVRISYRARRDVRIQRLASQADQDSIPSG